MNIWLIMILVMVLSFIVQQMLQSRFEKYSKVPLSNGMSGAEVALKMLHDNGIYDVKVVPTRGMLTDNYNPTTKTLSLSESVYGNRNVAAAAVAAHECGHAIQHAKGYAPLSFRSALVPVANIGSSLAWPLIIIGALFNNRMSMTLIEAGIILFSLAVLFQLVTLPVEINASRRAMVMLREQAILGDQELNMTRKVLTAAALTYVAGAASAILQLLRIILLFGGRDDRD